MKIRRTLTLMLAAGGIGAGIVIAFLAAPGFRRYSTSIRKANEVTLAQNLLLMRTAVDQYHSDRDRYPATLEVLVDEKYIRAVPTDPFTRAADTWAIELSNAQPGNSRTTSGVFDVKSGSDQTAVDGSRYANW